MKVFYCTDHHGHYVGRASVIVAPDEDAARVTLTEALNNSGLRGYKPFTLTELDISKAHALILCDGDY